MITFSKNNIMGCVIAAVSFLALLSATGCFTSKAVAGKSGAQLWAENCQRCHNTPSPASFSPKQWQTIGMHMQTRALLTNEERDKIVAFLKQQ
jgi:cytochrome c2